MVKQLLLVAVSLASMATITAQPYLTTTGGTYEKVTAYTQVKDGDILIWASHSTKDTRNEVRIMTTAATEKTGYFGFYTYSDYDASTGMPATITLSEVNKDAFPYEYAVTYDKKKSSSGQYMSLQNIDTKYIIDTPNKFALSDSRDDGTLWLAGNSVGNNILRINIGGNALCCEDRVTTGYDVDNGYFFTAGTFGDANRVYPACPYRKVHNLSIGEDGYSTFYYGNNDTQLPNGVKAYTYQLDGDKLTPSHTFDGEINDVVPHATAVIVKGTPGSYSLDVKNAQTANTYTNILRGSDEVTTTQQDDDAAGSKYYLLCKGSEGIGFYYKETDGSAFNNGAHKAYLTLGMSAAAKGFSFVLPDTPTDVKSCNGVDEETISNVSDKWYDLYGRRVTQPTKGLYINNGRIFSL